MRQDTSVLLKALFCSLRPESFNEYFRFFQGDFAKRIQEAEEVKLDLGKFFSLKEWMERIHYSWFLPFLEIVPKESLPYFLFLFSKDDQKELKNLLHVEQTKKPTFDLFMLSLMKEKIYPPDILPFDLLKKTELYPLLHLSKKESVLVADLLGIYDLAFEMRQIVDKTLIQKIQSTLSKEERAFLDIAIKTPVKWTPPKLNLSNWDGDSRKLKNLLHYRGLYRLAMATYDEENDFRWYLSHQLDIGRGKVLLKFYAEQSDKASIGYFKAQTMDILKRFTR